MKTNTAITAVIVLMISIFFGYIFIYDTQYTVTPTPTPTPPPTPTPTPIITPVYVAPTPTPTPVPVNDTNGSIYDNRSASWLYSHGYYGNGGGGIRHNNPPSPIPETATFYSVAIGALGLRLLCRRSS